MAATLLYGDTIRYPALRHEVPLEIVDSLLFVVRDGDAFVLTSTLESARIAEAVPGVELLIAEELGFYELLEAGASFEEAERETAVRALRSWGIEDAVVPGNLPVALADRLRAAGIAIAVDDRTVDARRRVKTPAELAGIRRAQRAAARPGITGVALYDIAADIVERAGYPTQRTRERGQTLTYGFCFGLGHGVGLEVHEPPWLGLAGNETLVAGDVVAIEPGIEGLEGIGGVRFEDLLLITEASSESLTRYSYDL